MNKLVCSSFILAAMMSLNAQSVVGKWKTIDDESGKAKAIVELYKEDGKLFGKITDIFEKERKNDICTKCGGKLKDQPVLGMHIIDGFSYDDEEDSYKGKKLTDPSKGLTVRGKIWLHPEDTDKLMVRGYLAFLYRTQTWLRISD